MSVSIFYVIGCKLIKNPIDLFKSNPDYAFNYNKVSMQKLRKKYPLTFTDGNLFQLVIKLR
jgi:hypothetical protein